MRLEPDTLGGYIKITDSSSDIDIKFINYLCLAERLLAYPCHNTTHIIFYGRGLLGLQFFLIFSRFNGTIPASLF